MTREEIKGAWERKKPSRQLLGYVRRLLAEDDFGEWRYIIAMQKKPGPVVAHEEIMALFASEINSPFSHPYFAVKTDSHLMLARLLLTGISAWEFKTGKRIVRK